MKKLYYLQILGLCMLIIQGCSKNSGSNAVVPPSTNSINIVVAPNQPYQLYLTGATAASIVKQASHYQTSETVSNSENSSTYYKYQPGADYTGKDQVTLSTTTMTVTSSSTTECPNSSHADNTSSSATYTTSYTTVNITVSN